MRVSLSVSHMQCQETLDDDQIPVQRVVLNEALTSWLIGVRVRNMVDGVQVRSSSYVFLVADFTAKCYVKVNVTLCVYVWATCVWQFGLTNRQITYGLQMDWPFCRNTAIGPWLLLVRNSIIWCVCTVYTVDCRLYRLNTVCSLHIHIPYAYHFKTQHVMLVQSLLGHTIQFSTHYTNAITFLQLQNIELNSVELTFVVWLCILNMSLCYLKSNISIIIYIYMYFMYRHT